MKFLDFGNLKGSNPATIAARFFLLTLGAAIYAVSVALFLDPSDLVSGGFTGISILLNRILPFELNTGLIVLIMNVPLMVAGLIVFGKEFLFSSVYATVVSSLLIFGFEEAFKSFLPIIHDDLILSSVLGGLIAGFGRAVIFRSGGTTGGTDTIVRFLHLKFQNVSFGKMLIMMDIVVIALSAVVFKNLQIALYSGCAIVISNVCFDKIVYGVDKAKMLYIISDKADGIKKRLLDELHVGVTVLDGHGAYRGDAKNVLLVAVKKNSYPKMKDVIKEEDPNAFFIVTSATEIYGLNFKKNDKKEL